MSRRCIHSPKAARTSSKLNKLQKQSKKDVARKPGRLSLPAVDMALSSADLSLIMYPVSLRTRRRTGVSSDSSNDTSFESIDALTTLPKKKPETKGKKRYLRRPAPRGLSTYLSKLGNLI